MPDSLAYFHLDHLGTPIEMTDRVGKTVWEASYQAWGEVEMVSGSLKQPFRFQGQYFDEESGLHYNRFRYYDPSSGRFVSQDPIGLLGGGNLYAYVDNPNQWIDPLGLKSHAKELADAMAQKGRRLKPGQTAHHIVQENKSNIYINESKRILGKFKIDYRTDADNGAALWGTHPSQIKQTGHPGRGCSAYHDWNVHSPHSDQRIMKLLQRAEPDGEIAVRATLKAIGTKMEQGRWKTPIDCKTGKYKQP